MPAIYKNGIKMSGTPSIPVTQSTGSSTTTVMSQKAVTDQITTITSNYATKTELSTKLTVVLVEE